MNESLLASLENKDSFYVAKFSAMASPCEVLIDTLEPDLAKHIGECVAKEAVRVEQTFSRYRKDNLIYQINNSYGRPIQIDQELADLLKFADNCYQLSNGLFDITSGVLRKVWRFDGSDNIPSRKQAKALLPFIGWDKVDWNNQQITLPEGMEIDLGGIGKEYAVDRSATLVQQSYSVPVLINFGGDLFSTQVPNNKEAWQVGVEAIGGAKENAIIQLKHGGLATSGDARRFLLRKGVRYSHVLNPRTAWPVSHAPSSVTVAAPRCIDAGFLSTLAMLQGKDAQSFLEAQDVLFWIQK
jgi:thiamine biosynthesis lipoprotein